MIIINILAGGMGSRMGGNKPLYIHSGKPLISHVIDSLKPQCDEVWLNIGAQNSEIANAFLNYPQTKIFDNEYSNLGPLSGVYSGLKQMQNKPSAYYITAPCDMPNLPQNYVGKLVDEAKNHANKIIYYKGERDFPICALWPNNCFESLKDCLNKAENGAKVMSFINEYGAIPALIDDETAFLNINYKQ